MSQVDVAILEVAVVIDMLWKYIQWQAKQDFMGL